ncbi:MAG: hypothetical protein ACFFB8_18275 [Promethearchaeota archaeon]
MLRSNLSKKTTKLEKEINQYITLRLINGKTYIYVNGRMFIQCIRLILNISKDEVPLYEEVESIDEAAQIYSNHIFQNRIIRGPMAAPLPDQRHDITPEQEFWGHCSNIQAWVEHDYDTRILMSNISFPLLRELSNAGDPKAKKIYKEEIALRLESGYPSVIQYLLAQKYIDVFSPEEFKTILETTKIVKILSSDSKMLTQFLICCFTKFPTYLEDILVQILKHPESKNLFFSVFQIRSEQSSFKPYLIYNNTKFLSLLKNALENIFNRFDEKTSEDILDCIHAINNKLEIQPLRIPIMSKRRYLDDQRNLMINDALLKALGERKELLMRLWDRKLIRIDQSRCSYCRKEIPKGQDICPWCGHKKDDDEGGFFPYPFIFKPPGGGGGSMKGIIAVSVKV